MPNKPENLARHWASSGRPSLAPLMQALAEL